MAIARETKVFTAQKRGPHYVTQTTLHHLARSLATPKEGADAWPEAPDVPRLQADSTTHR
eukprot:8735745-Pyramimonas_sp.AAC.1